MNALEVLDWKPMVEKAARAIARDFPETTVEDLEQTVWLGLLEKQAEGKMLDPEADNMESALIYIARSAAWDERKDHLTISAQYGYRTTDVRALLETFFDRRDWYDAVVPADAFSELGNVGLEMSSDLSRAWDQLIPRYRELIFRKFALREEVDSKKVSRAISRMADILNTWQPSKRPPGPGNRVVISNAHAGYIIRNQDGDSD